MADRNKKAAALRQYRIDAGVCKYCGKEKLPDRLICAACAKYHKEYDRKQYAAKCGHPLPDTPDRRVKHGAAGTPEYNAFSSAKGRCTNPKNRCWSGYGGAGIKFLFTSFDQWLDELGPRPSPHYSVDRENTHGNYEPGNVRWATKKEQANNRAKYKAITGFMDDELLAECRRRNLGAGQSKSN